MSVVDDSFDHPLTLEEHASMPLAGGIEQMGFQCGQLWGAALAAGAAAYQRFGSGPRAEAAAVIAAQRLVDSFQTSYKSVNCFEMDRVTERGGKVEFNSPEATEAIDRFVQSTGCEFECSQITGRRFETVGEHAGYLRKGGCSRLIKVLADA